MLSKCLLGITVEDMPLIFKAYHLVSVRLIGNPKLVIGVIVIVNGCRSEGGPYLNMLYSPTIIIGTTHTLPPVRSKSCDDPKL